MYRNNFFKAGFLALLTIVMVSSCKKGEHIDNIITSPEVAHFITLGNTMTAPYYIQNVAGDSYDFEIGVTTVSDQDRTINITYTSPTGAAQGAQFNAPTTVTIPAGEATAQFSVNGIFAGYPTGRVDTLKISLTAPSGTKSGFNDPFTLIMQKYCPVVLTSMHGMYNNTRDITPAYGPYTTEITSSTTAGTQGTITLANFWDYGFNPLVFKLNWSNPANFTVTLDPQNTGQDAGIMSSAYAGMPLWIYPPASGTGKFSSCDENFTINFRLGIPGLGYFPAYQTVVAR